jgi:hypothetical protein
MRSVPALITLLALTLSLVSCTSGGGGGDDGPSNPGGGRTADCGFSIDGRQSDSFGGDDAAVGTLTAVQSGNPVSVLLESGPLLVQLPGVGLPNNEAARTRFRTVLAPFIGQPVQVVLGRTPCSVQIGDENSGGVVAHVVAQDGTDLSERLIQSGIVRNIGADSGCENPDYR